MKVCKNCGQVIEDKFCARCGQKADTHRLTLPHLMHEIAHSVTHADKGVFFFVRNLFSRPGGMAVDYLEGKRKRYFNPFTFFVIVLGIWVLVFPSTFIHPRGVDEIANPEQYKMMEFVGKYMKLLFLICLPLVSLLTYLIYKKHRNSYAEHITINTFVLGGIVSVMIVWALVMLVFGISPRYEFIGKFFTEVAFSTWVFIGLYPKVNKFLVLLCQLLVVALYYTFTTLIVMLAFSMFS